MKVVTKFFILFLTFLTIGCERDKSFSPPNNGETVSIAVQLPKEMDVLPLGVMYRSNLCLHKRTKGNGEIYKLPGFHFTQFTLKQEGNEDIYHFPVPIDGGGACHWQLSNVTVNIKYKKENFGNDINRAIGTGVIIIFDNNSPQQDDGVYENVSGDLIIEKDYFPWINERFLDGHSRNIWTYGERLYFNYKVKDTYNVLFRPISHSEYVTHSVGIKVKAEGNHAQFTYPDGTVVADGTIFPDFKKLQSLIKK
jgi:hypothetical protein